MSVAGFGGVLPWARRAIVEERKWLTAEEFNEAFSFSQFLPGPNIVNFSVVFGSRLRGAAGAAVALARSARAAVRDRDHPCDALCALWRHRLDARACSPASPPRPPASSSRRSRKWRSRFSQVAHDRVARLRALCRARGLCRDRHLALAVALCACRRWRRSASRSPGVADEKRRRHSPHARGTFCAAFAVRHRRRQCRDPGNASRRGRVAAG